MEAFTEEQMRQFARDCLNNPAFIEVLDKIEYQHISAINNWSPDKDVDLISLQREYYFSRAVKRKLTKMTEPK